MTLDDDHDGLPTQAESLIRTIETLGSRFVVGDTGRYMQHDEFAERGRILGDHLRAALVLSDEAHYAAAFVVLRTALEHHLVDRLVLLANRYLQVYPVKKANTAAEDQRLRELKAGPRPDIVRWSMGNGKMNVIVKGLYPQGSLGHGPTVSPYYFVVDQYDPFTGRPWHVGQIAGSFVPVGDRRRRATEARALWESLFVYEKLKRNLTLNHLLTRRQAIQLDTHYGFLSAYNHGAGQAYRLLYGHNHPSSIGVHDHYASELVLLYVVTIASEEILAFARMAKRPPVLHLADWSATETEVAAAKSTTSYFWFFSDAPQLLDRVNEVHTRLARRKQPWALPPQDPMAIQADRVKYYVNPMVRLKELHRDLLEMTSGQTSPALFPRPDAYR
jgi:hypothetical protein